MLTPTSKEKTEEVKLIVFVSSKPNTQTSQWYWPYEIGLRSTDGQ